MPENKNARELLLHGLKDMYDAEHKFAEALKNSAGRTKDRTLADGLRRHREVTLEQIERLEECFGDMNERPQRETCAGAEGLIEEYTSFVKKERPDSQTHDLFAAGANLKVEHYEIAAYAGMIDLALRLDLNDSANRLMENLREEEAAAAELEMASRKLGAELTGSSAGLRGAVATLRAPMRSGGLGAVARAVTGQAGDMVNRLEQRGRRARASSSRSTAGSKAKASSSRSTTRGRSTGGRRKAASRSATSTNGRRTTTRRASATGSRSRTGTGRTRSTARGRATTTARGRTTTRSARRPASRSGSRTAARRTTSRSTTSRGRTTRSRARGSR